MIKIEKIEEMCKGNYITLKKLYFTENNKHRVWEIAELYDSVAILIFNVTKQAFVLVKQFRPAVYLKNSDGFTYELCAGICDKKLSLKEIAIEEIEEETGYKVDDIAEINTFYTSVGSAGAKQTMFYAEVEDKDKITSGGGIDDENIEVVELPISEMEDFMYDTSKVKTPGLLYAFEWWRNQAIDTMMENVENQI
jgi:UDP-sugar diphosphatase